MKIFASPLVILSDLALDVIPLDIDNLDSVESDDIVIGSGTFQDELVIKALINRACLPFFVTLSKDNEVSHMFKNLTVVLSANTCFANQENILEILDIYKMTYLFEENIREFNKHIELEESLQELYIANQYLLNHFILRSGQKSAETETLKPIEELYIYIQEGKKRKNIYVILQERKLLKVFRYEVDKRFEVNDKLIKNNFKKKFKFLMQRHQEKYSFREYDFKNITVKYKREFLLIDAAQKKLLDINLFDFVLKLNSDSKLEKIALYRLYSRTREIDEAREDFLSTIHSYLNNRGNSIVDIQLFLRGRELGEVFRDREKKANVVADVFIKFIEKLNDFGSKKRLSNFSLATITLRGAWESLDKHILTNIFYHLSDGIGINSIIKKEYTRFVHNFESYRAAVEEAEETLEFGECYDRLEAFVDSYPLNERVLDIRHIEKLRNCLNEEYELSKKLDKLYSQLAYQELGGYDIEALIDRDNFEDQFIKKNDYTTFVDIMINAFYRLKGFDGIKQKELALFISYIAYWLSIEEDDNSIDCCFFTFFNLYADREPENLLLALNKYFIDRDISVVTFFQNRESYNCVGDKQNIILKTDKYRDKSAKCEKFRQQKNRKFKQDFLKIGACCKLVTGQEKMDEVIQTLLDRVRAKEPISTTYCQQQAVIEFLKIFFSGSKKCEVRVSYLFKCFEEAYCEVV